MALEHINRDQLERLSGLPTAVTSALTAAAGAADPRVEAAVGPAMLEKLYPDPNVRKLLPKKDGENIERAATEDWRAAQETGPLYEVGKFAYDQTHQQLIDQIEQDARRPPSPRSEWMAENHLTSVSTTDALLIALLDSHLTSRAEQRLDKAPPSVVLQNYVFGDSATKRWIEARHGDGWSGISSDDTRELSSVAQLHRVIASDRAARVPPEVAAARAALQQAGAFLQRVQTLRGLRPRRREV